MSQSQISEAGKTVDQTVSSSLSTHDLQVTTDCQEGSNICDITEIDKLSYDWDICETLQIVKSFPISDYATKSDDLSLSGFLVPESPSLSGIIDSISSGSSSSNTTDIEEKYIEDDMSSLSDISDVKVSSSPRKHTFGKERVERKGNMYDKLYNACLKGQINVINDTLKRYSETLMPNEDGQTPLHAACIGDHPEVVKLLIDSGYDVNHQDADGKTPLHAAFENHAPKVVESLMIQFSANTEIRDKQNWTPLHTAIDRGYYSYSQQLAQFLCQDVGTEVSWIQLQAACFNENTKYVKFLLDAKTNVNRNNSAGHAPLHIAVTKGNINIITLLLDQNVDINDKTIDGKTPLHIALENGEETIIQTLLAQKADTNVKDAPGNTSLHLAVKIKREIRPRLVKAGASSQSSFQAPYRVCSAQTVQAIIDHGADVNAVNNRGQTPLWFACIGGQEQTVKMLLHNGADPNIADVNSDTCLHAAMYGQCSTATVQEIIDHYVDINAVNKDGATPLLLACDTAQTETVKLLLKAQSDVNIANTDGDACLHTAVAAYGSTETLQEIIDNGGDVNVVNKRGRTPLLLSCFYGQMDFIRILLGAGADSAIADEEGFSCLHAAVDGRCSTNTLQELIDHGAHINAIREDGTTALLCACRTGQSESVIFLLEAGADVKIKKFDGNTTLHVAVSGNCSREALQKIIERGVNVNAANNNGETALIKACYSGQTKSVTLLLKNKADPNIYDTKGCRSLHAAVIGNCTHDTLQEIASKSFVDAQTFVGAETALYIACLRRQQDLIRILLEAKANPNITSTEGLTSLHAAVIGGCSKRIIQEIIKHGADINATNKSGITTLIVACWKDNVEAINVLLNAKADCNITDATGETCIHHAVHVGCSKEILQAIIANGADVNATDNYKRTALMIGCQNDNVEAITVLLSAGADSNTADINGGTWIHYAAFGGCRKETLQAIIGNGADVNVTDKSHATALMVACGKGNVEAISVLLSTEVNCNITDADGATSIHHAVYGGCSKETLQAIINHGADINSADNYNRTPLMRGCWKNNAEAINVLLNAGADTNITCADGGTWMHYAVQGGCGKETLQTLIDNGADINATDKNNFTPLMIGCWKGNVEAINVLLYAGADTNITAYNGATWIHQAVIGNYSKQTLQAIINHGADINAADNDNKTPLMIGCFKDNVEAIDVLLNAGADSNITDSMGATWIHYAVHGDCSKETLQAIIDNGADINAAGNDKKTALMTGCWKGNIEAINVLLNAGADSNITDDVGATCIHHAIHGSFSKETLQAIIDHGADINATDNNNRTALMLACNQDNVEAINVLVNAGADTKITDDNGATWIDLAVHGGCSKDTLQAIINHGAEVNVRDKHSVTALMVACWKENVDAINILLNAGADPTIADTKGFTSIHYSVHVDCSKETLSALIDHGADVNIADKNNKTALMTACKMKYADTMSVLLNLGADPNIVDCNGETCLHAAVRSQCNNAMLQEVIDHGVDVNVRSKYGGTAIMIACMHGMAPKENKDAINVLLNAGADPNITGTVGETCLHAAVSRHCSKEVLHELIDHGVDVNARSKNGVTAITIACMQGVSQKENIEAINVLLNAGANLRLALHRYVVVAINIHHDFGQSYANELLKQMFIKM